MKKSILILLSLWLLSTAYTSISASPGEDEIVDYFDRNGLSPKGVIHSIKGEWEINWDKSHETGGRSIADINKIIHNAEYFIQAIRDKVNKLECNITIEYALVDQPKKFNFLFSTILSKKQ